MSIRHTLIRYLSLNGTKSVGTGYFVNSHAVLMANHVARGTNHQLIISGRDPIPIAEEQVLRSGCDEVDIAVLMLKDPVGDFEQKSYARFDRSGGVTVDGVWAIGFPRNNKDGQGRATLQVMGYIRPGDDFHPEAPQGADREWLTLIGTETSWRPYVSSELDEVEDINPWGGMSGAAVIKDGLVVGVIRSHNAQRGPQSLSVTPLTALKTLPIERRQLFCDALGLKDFSKLTILGGDESETLPVTVRAPGFSEGAFSGDEFSEDVRDHYHDRLAEGGLPVPDRWDIIELDKLRRDHRVKDDAAALLDSLCLALPALPVLNQFGGRKVRIDKLRHLYNRHVGGWPGLNSVEGMLISAASATIAERRRADQDPGYQPVEPVTPLGRFMLSVAGHWIPAATESDVRPIIDWLTNTLRQQEEDVIHYLDTRVGVDSWALIELDDEDSPEETQPRGITVYVIPESGLADTQWIPVTVSAKENDPKECVRVALKEAVSRLPEDCLFVDLSLPRHWLGAGLEYLDVVQVGDDYEPISQHYKPRLRWAMHRRDHHLRRLQRERFRTVDWMASPETIPCSITSDPTSFESWCEDRDVAGVRHPPYVAGASNSDYGHDPLGLLLKKGHGLAVWFGDAAVDDLCARAAKVANGMGAAERQHDLPDKLANTLKKHKPTIIWSDPSGRAGFLMPTCQAGGTRRGGAI